LASLSKIEGISHLSTSPFDQTAPWGDDDQDWFLNACSTAFCDLSPSELLQAIKTIEAELGRVKSRRWGPRLIDIDILVYGDLEMESEELTIPHLHLTKRAFVLVPLLDVWPDLTVAGLPISSHLAQLTREEGDIFPFAGPA